MKAGLCEPSAESECGSEAALVLLQSLIAYRAGASCRCIHNCRTISWSPLNVGAPLSDIDGWAIRVLG